MSSGSGVLASWEELCTPLSECLVIAIESLEMQKRHYKKLEKSETVMGERANASMTCSTRWPTLYNDDTSLASPWSSPNVSLV